MAQSFYSDIDANRRINVTSSTHFEAKGDIVYFGSGSTTQGELCYLRSNGMFTLDQGGMTMGDELYIGANSQDGISTGDITATAPAGSADVVRVVGYCVGSEDGQIWFNPSNDFILLA